jgi:2-isopropylmalate synthase
MRRISIFDTTLRDGEQAPGFAMTPDEKVRMAEELECLGVDVIEVGFPASAPSERLAATKIARRIRRTKVAVMARALTRDIDACREVLRAAAHPRLHVFIAASDQHIEQKLRVTREAVKQAANDAVRYARNLCDDVQFGCEDATRADTAFLCELLDIAIGAGASTVTIADTVGALTPNEYAALISCIRNTVPDIDRVSVAAHCHDDLGLATANSLAAVSAGASQVECTLAGIGERAGNAALEEIVVALSTKAEVYQAYANTDNRRLVPAVRVLEEITGVHAPPNKAVVGSNAFRHGAGIHQHGVLVNEKLYQLIASKDVGGPTGGLVFGKYSGRHAIEELIAKRGVDAQGFPVDTLLAYIKRIADKHSLTESEAEAAIREFVASRTQTAAS